MRKGINQVYREAAEEFSRRVASALGDEVHSIVLYGSVARKQAKRDSDIDVLVISRDSRSTRWDVSDLRSDFTHERDYEFFISLVHLSREQFYDLSRIGSPFIFNVLREGVTLYDDDTFAGVRQQAIPVGR